MKRITLHSWPVLCLGSYLRHVASVWKSLQGLDSYAAEGGHGFDDLLSLLDTLVQYGANEDVITELKDNFKYLKQYIKSDYKVKE